MLSTVRSGQVAHFQLESVLFKPQGRPYLLRCLLNPAHPLGRSYSGTEVNQTGTQPQAPKPSHSRLHAFSPGLRKRKDSLCFCTAWLPPFQSPGTDAASQAMFLGPALTSGQLGISAHSGAHTHTQVCTHRRSHTHIHTHRCAHTGTLMHTCLCVSICTFTCVYRVHMEAKSQCQVSSPITVPFSF